MQPLYKIRKVLGDIQAILQKFDKLHSRIAKEIDSSEDCFCIDSRPIEICGKRCRMGHDGDFSRIPDFGYCASQSSYFFGYKIYALCELNGIIHSYALSKASVHNIHYLKDIDITIAVLSAIKAISEQRCSLTCLKQQTSNLNVRTD